MLRKLIWVFVVLPAGLVLLAFALANRHDVRLSFDPFSTDNPVMAFDGPFFLFLFAAFLGGIVTGGLVTWLGQGKWRKAARDNAREAASLRQERERHAEELAELNAPEPEAARAAE